MTQEEVGGVNGTKVKWKNCIKRHYIWEERTTVNWTNGMMAVSATREEMILDGIKDKGRNNISTMIKVKRHSMPRELRQLILVGTKIKELTGRLTLGGD